MVRRHRLIETFLVTSLDYDWGEVHDEAEQLEHAVSDLMVQRIDRFLGHPVADPHGDPIPGPDGALPTPANTIGLPDAAPEPTPWCASLTPTPNILARLRTHNIAPGTPIRVHATPGPTPNTHVTGPNGQPLAATDTATIRVRHLK